MYTNQMVVKSFVNGRTREKNHNPKIGCVTSKNNTKTRSHIYIHYVLRAAIRGAASVEKWSTMNTFQLQIVTRSTPTSAGIMMFTPASIIWITVWIGCCGNGIHKFYSNLGFSLIRQTHLHIVSIYTKHYFFFVSLLCAYYLYWYLSHSSDRIYIFLWRTASHSCAVPIPMFLSISFVFLSFNADK